MKHFFTLCIIIFSSLSTYAQILEPVKWTTSVEKINDTEAILTAKAKIENGWHLYSQTAPELGPVPTSFTYNGGSEYMKKGNTQEGEGIMIHDPVFNVEIKFFKDEATFTQRIKLNTKKAFNIKGSVEFMVCDDERCLPPTETDLEFKVE